MFTKYKTILKNGLTGHICERLDDYILVYGGSDFENKYDRKVYNDYYIFDLDFNLLKHSRGKIYPEAGIKIKDKNVIWYILNDKIYKMYIKDLELVEEEFFILDYNFNSGFGVIVNDSLIFGYDKVFRFDINSKKITNLSNFIGEPRSQSVFSKYEDYIYVLGGGSSICYLDTYRYSIKDDKWEKLNDLNISLLGASSIKIDDENLLIIGGFNKEVYDKAVISLKDPSYKKEYFAIDKKDFKWNEKILKYNFKSQEFTILEKSDLASICGGTLININDSYYLVLGEIKPGLRSKDVYRYKMEAK